jgi:hypothetical protein
MREGGKSEREETVNETSGEREETNNEKDYYCLIRRGI